MYYLNKNLIKIFSIALILFIKINAQLTHEQALEHAKTFSTKQYNIFAYALGTNCYPIDKNSFNICVPFYTFDLTLQYIENPFNKNEFNQSELENYLKRILDLINRFEKDIENETDKKIKAQLISQLDEIVSYLVTLISLVRATGKYQATSGKDFTANDSAIIETQIRKSLFPNNIYNTEIDSKEAIQNISKTILNRNYGLTNNLTVASLFDERNQKRQNIINSIKLFDESKKEIEKRVQEEEKSDESTLEKLRKQTVKEREKLLIDRLTEFFGFALDAKNIEGQIAKFSNFEANEILAVFPDLDIEKMPELIKGLESGYKILMNFILIDPKLIQKKIDEIISELEESDPKKFDENVKQKFADKFEKEVFEEIRQQTKLIKEYDPVVDYLLFLVTSVTNFKKTLNDVELTEIKSVKEKENFLLALLTKFIDEILNLKKINVDIQNLSAFDKDKLYKKYEQTLEELHDNLYGATAKIAIILNSLLPKDLAIQVNDALGKILFEIEAIPANQFNPTKKNEFADRFQREVIDKIKLKMEESKEYKETIDFMNQLKNTTTNLKTEAQRSLESLSTLQGQEKETTIKDTLNKIFDAKLNSKLLNAKIDKLNKDEKDKFNVTYKSDLETINSNINNLENAVTEIINKTSNATEIGSAYSQISSQLKEFSDNFSDVTKESFKSKFQNEVINKIKTGPEVPESLKKYLTQFPNLLTNPNELIGGKSALHIAVTNKDLNAVKEILNIPNSNINVQTPDKVTALHFAVFGNLPEITKYLIEKGIDKSIKKSNGETALDQAKRLNRVEIIKLLQ